MNNEFPRWPMTWLLIAMLAGGLIAESCYMSETKKQLSDKAIHADPDGGEHE